jgi:hypothetical protein
MDLNSATFASLYTRLGTSGYSPNANLKADGTWSIDIETGRSGVLRFCYHDAAQKLTVKQKKHLFSRKLAVFSFEAASLNESVERAAELAVGSMRQSNMPERHGPPGLLVRVIEQLSRNHFRVKVGIGVGMMDGGIETNWPIDWLPVTCLRPNAEFWISGFVGGKPQLVQSDA